MRRQNQCKRFKPQAEKMKLAGAARQQQREAITTQEVGELPADYTGTRLYAEGGSKLI